MIEIEFRGKRKDNNEWIYGYFYKHEAPLQCIKSENETSEKEKCFIIFTGFADWNMPRQIYQSEVIPQTIGQYVGIMDKKKQKVYAGDLFYYHGILRKIVYRKDNASFMAEVVKRHIGSCDFYLKDIIDKYTNKLNAEVIGNIDDNKELI